MTSRSISRCVSGLALILALNGAIAVKAADSGLISDAEARRIGLEVDWYTHVSINPARGHVAHLTYHVAESRTTTIFEVIAGARTNVYRETDPDPFGEPLGIDGAQRMAEARAEVLRAEGLEPEVSQLVLPEITIYAISDESVVHAIDAETGSTRWAVAVGDRHHPAMPLAVDDEFVVVVNGMRVYFLESNSGRVAWEKELRNAPGSGAAMSSRYAFIPLINGRLEAFPLWSPDVQTEVLISVGLQFVPAYATPRTVAWPNDRGQLNVAYTDRITTVQYRLQTDRDIVSPATSIGGTHLVACSTDGYVHCFQEINGRIDWAVSTGESMQQSPVAIGDTVFAVGVNGNLFQISHPSGIVERIIPGISSFIAASESRIYCLGRTQELLVLDRNSGAIVGRLPVLDLDMTFVNPMTDRIYIGSSKGPVQCLHELGRDYPYYHITPDFESEPDSDDGDDDAPENPYGAIR